jgi:hypothetical protein
LRQHAPDASARATVGELLAKRREADVRDGAVIGGVAVSHYRDTLKSGMFS